MTEEDDRRTRRARMQQLEEGRREHRIEVEFWNAYPYDRTTGERLAKEFIAAMTEIVGIVEQVNDPSAVGEAERNALEERWLELHHQMPPYYSVQMFFTEEQSVALAEIHARFDRVLEGDDDDED